MCPHNIGMHIDVCTLYINAHMSMYGCTYTYWPFYTFLAKYYLYSFAYILPRPSTFSRIFSNIENIFITRQVDGGQKPL